jgi:hypothetical protein
MSGITHCCGRRAWVGNLERMKKRRPESGPQIAFLYRAPRCPMEFLPVPELFDPARADLNRQCAGEKARGQLPTRELRGFQVVLPFSFMTESLEEKHRRLEQVARVALVETRFALQRAEIESLEGALEAFEKYGSAKGIERRLKKLRAEQRAVARTLHGGGRYWGRLLATLFGWSRSRPA